MSFCFCSLWVPWALGVNLVTSQPLASLAGGGLALRFLPI